MAPIVALLFVAHVHIVAAWMPSIPMGVNKLSRGSSLCTRCGPALSTKQKEGEATRNLFVTRFGKKATSSSLQELFSIHADVLNVNRRHTSNGAYAFVQTSSVEDAIAAKAALHGSGSQSVGSKRLIVRFADDRYNRKDDTSIKHTDIIIETTRAAKTVQGSTNKSASKNANAILEPNAKQMPKMKKVAGLTKNTAELSQAKTSTKKTSKAGVTLTTKTKVQQPAKKKSLVGNAEGGTELKTQQPSASVFGDATTPRRDRRRRQEAKFKALKLEHPEIFQQVADAKRAAAAKPKAAILKSAVRRGDFHSVLESFMEGKAVSTPKIQAGAVSSAAPSTTKKVNKKPKAATASPATRKVGNTKQRAAVATAATASTVLIKKKPLLSQPPNEKTPAGKGNKQAVPKSAMSSNKSQGKTKATTASATAPSGKVKKTVLPSLAPLPGKTDKSTRSTASSQSAENKKVSKAGSKNIKQSNPVTQGKAKRSEATGKSDAAAPTRKPPKSGKSRVATSTGEVARKSAPEMASLRALLMEL